MRGYSILWSTTTMELLPCRIISRTAADPARSSLALSRGETIFSRRGYALVQHLGEGLTATARGTRLATATATQIGQLVNVPAIADGTALLVLTRDMIPAVTMEIPTIAECAPATLARSSGWETSVNILNKPLAAVTAIRTIMDHVTATGNTPGNTPTTASTSE